MPTVAMNYLDSFTSSRQKFLFCAETVKRFQVRGRFLDGIPITILMLVAYLLALSI